MCLFSSQEEGDIVNLPSLGKEGAGHPKGVDTASVVVRVMLFSSQAPKGPSDPLRRQTGRRYELTEHLAITISSFISQAALKVVITTLIVWTMN